MFDYNQQQALYNMAQGQQGAPFAGPSFVGGGSSGYNQQPSAQSSGYPQGGTGSPWGQASQYLGAPGSLGSPTRTGTGPHINSANARKGGKTPPSQPGWTGTPGEMPPGGGHIAGGGSTGGSHPRPYM